MEQSNTKPRECWQCDERKYDCMSWEYKVVSIIIFVLNVITLRAYLCILAKAGRT